jgi:hypothetical protein
MDLFFTKVKVYRYNALWYNANKKTQLLLVLTLRNCLSTPTLLEQYTTYNWKNTNLKFEKLLKGKYFFFNPQLMWKYLKNIFFK